MDKPKLHVVEPTEGVKFDEDHISNTAKQEDVETKVEVQAEAEIQPSIEQESNDNQTARKFMPPVIKMQALCIAAVGIVILMIAVISSISTKNIGAMKIAILSLAAFILCAMKCWMWYAGLIIRKKVLCIAVTRYMGAFGPYTVTFLDEASGQQHVFSVNSNNCPYARGVHYVIYAYSDFQGRIIAYEDGGFNTETAEIIDEGG